MQQRSLSTSIRTVLPSANKELLDSNERDVVLSTIRGFLRLVQQHQDGVASIDGKESDVLPLYSNNNGTTVVERKKKKKVTRAGLDSQQTVALDLAEFLFG